MVKYVDIHATMQVIGGVYVDNSLLDNANYTFNEDDFSEEFHKILFGSIYNLHLQGSKKITAMDIEQYLEKRPKAYGVYKSNKGTEYLEKLPEITQLSTFSYYYNRVKKMSLFRTYQRVIGLDLTWLYNPNEVLNIKKKEAQEDWLDSTPIEEIVEIVDKKIEDVKIKCLCGSTDDLVHAASGIMDFVESLKESPEYGFPMYGHYINTITRGARLKKVYLRSSATGVGKTRSMVADACTFSCSKIYDSEKQQWEESSSVTPTLFIATEQDLNEVQSLLLAFVADVDEEHILTGKYEDGEWERIVEAVKVIEEAPLYIEELPDFSMQDIENTIKKGIHEYGVQTVLFDYLHSSMKILGEVSSKAGVKNLREDNVLFMISVKLKDMANQYGIFILTATQLNGTYVNSTEHDQNMLRGSKAVADKVDVGALMVKVSKEDIDALQPLLDKGYAKPDIRLSIYKNRRGRYEHIILWCRSRLSSCRIIPMYATDYSYELVELKDTKITVEARSAF